MTKSPSFYYNFDKLFSYNFLIAFVIGERGVGKSFNAKVAVMKKFLKTGEQFIYMRRYKTELDSALATFFSDLQMNGYLEDYDLEVKKSKMLTTFKCNGKVCGYAVPLSTANILKSTAFPDVKTIIFDEFLLDNSGTYKYLKNEGKISFADIEECLVLVSCPSPPHIDPSAVSRGLGCFAYYLCRAHFLHISMIKMVCLTGSTI